VTPKLVYVPLAFAELLHATLGPLCDVLAEEGHDWVPMVQKVLREYTARRDQMLVNMHGAQILDAVHEHTLVAAEEVEHMVSESIVDVALGTLIGEFE
jgi:hypothetical protein